MSVDLLMWLIGGLFIYASGSYVYTWRVQGMIGSARTEGAGAINKQNEASQRALSGVMTRAETMISAEKVEREKGESDMEREIASHTLEDARMYATKKEMSDIFGELRTELRSISAKLDRVIERDRRS